MQTGDIRLIKNINERVVLNMIREHKLISAARLATITGMRPSTISSLLKDLQDKDLVINRGKGESTDKGGKKPFLWSLNSDVGYVVGLDLEIDEALAVLLNLEGEIVEQSVIQDNVVNSPRDLVGLTEQLVAGLTGKAGISADQLLGMGIGLTGVADVKNGIILKTGMLVETDIPFGKMLQDAYQFPIFIENNANAAAMGEKWLGKAAGVENFLAALVELDIHHGGFGIGIVVNGELFHGVSYAAGELNVTLPTLDAEFKALNTRLQDSTQPLLPGANGSKITIQNLINAAKSGEQAAAAYFNRLGYNIGRIIAPAIGLFNPQMLIIEGDVAELGKLVTDPIKSAIDLEVLEITSTALTIETGMHGRFAVSIGAASIILNDIFKVPLVTSNSIDTYF